MPKAPASAAGPIRTSGLEWLPAEPSIGRPHRPLVVILPWMWAARSAVSKHVALYHGLGWDVAVYRGWPALSVWIPALANRNAVVLLTALAAHLKDYPRDVILACFSGAAKGVLSPLLQRLAAAPLSSAPASATPPAPPPSQPRPSPGHPPQTQQARQAQHPPPKVADPPAQLLRCWLRGLLFDSGPVDFDSSVGVRLFANSQSDWVRRLQAAAGSAVAGLLDFCLYEGFEAQRRHMWASLRSSLASLGLPVLFLYSWSGDALADPQPIHALAVALRSETSSGGGGANSRGGEEGGGDGGTAGREHGGGGGVVGSGDMVRGEAAAPSVVCGVASSAHGTDRSSNSNSSGAKGYAGFVSSAGSVSPDGSISPDGSLSSAGAAGTASSAAAAETLSPGCYGLVGSHDRASPAGHDAGYFDNITCCSSGSCRGPGAGVALGRTSVLVWEQAWDSSAHVAHLREHPAQYREALAAFLERCLATTMDLDGPGCGG